MAIPRRHCRAADDVHLPANAAVDPRADRVRTTWPVRSTSIAELMATIPIVLRHDDRCRWCTRRVHLDHRVVVEELIEGLGAQDELATILPGAAFSLAGNDTPLDEVDDAVREQLRVDAEVLLVVEPDATLRDRADAGLQRGAVRDQSAIWAPILSSTAPMPAGLLERRVVDLDDQVDLADMDEGVAHVRGIEGLICTITGFAGAVASSPSTDRPNEQKPCASGGVT